MVHVRLLDAAGNPLPARERDGRRYVEGRDGERYIIELDNRSPQRFEVVATVDGLDVLDGQKGGFHKRGYILGPWSHFRIEGFRRTQDEVAAFRFGAVSDAYAAQKGDDTDVGVIGVAFFGERGAISWSRAREAERRHQADPFPGRFAEPPARRAW
jgi:hypothetical protein